MIEIQRYAVYYAPRPGAFAAATARWLGWDPATGTAPEQPELPGIPFPAVLTAEARRYGFHGTLRAPFRLAEGVTRQVAEETVAGLAASLPPVSCTGLQLESLQGFLAFTPMGCEAALLELAAAVVEATNPLRAPLTEAEVARRRPESLSARQLALLRLWGYPHVMEEFRFHLTLTDRLPEYEMPAVRTALQAYFAPVLLSPFVIEDLCLFGQEASGLFHLLHRYALTG
jgi:putative phosphonate metabolism protein